FGRAHSAGWVLAEDSGIEVDALGGRPGAHSARYAADDAAAIARLLAEMAGITERGARYVSELVLLGPDGREVRGNGTWEGVIADEARGTGGCGYDPVFVPVG